MIESERSLDVIPPPEIARRVESLGVAKAGLDTLTTLVLAGLAGAFISLGGALFIIAITQSTLGFGMTRVFGGLAFSLGLFLVVLAGAELFTGNNLIAMAWASGRLRLRDVARNWLLAYSGNVAGCLLTAALVGWAGLHRLGGDAVRATLSGVASGKVALPLGEALARSILCNALVCLAVWIALGGRSLVDKAVAVVFPVTAFVALGLEHSIANWFFLPWALWVVPEVVPVGPALLRLAIVTLGNVVGGTLLVAGIYWLAYSRPGLRGGPSSPGAPR